MPKKIIVLLLAGLSLGGVFFIYIYLTSGGNFYDALLQTDPVSEISLAEVTEEDNVENAGNVSSFGFSVFTQNPGKTAKVDTLNVNLPVFAVVYSDDNGNLGERLGVSQYIEPGFYTNLQFDLEKDLTSGQTVHFMLYSDEGNEKFGDRTDIPLREGQYNFVVRDVTVS